MSTRLGRLVGIVVSSSLIASCSTDPDVAEGLGTRQRVVIPVAADVIQWPSHGLPQQEIVVRDSVLWRLRWEEVARFMQPRPAPPVVDFGTVMIALISVGGRGSSAFSLVIDSMTVFAGGAVISATEHVGAGCPALAVITTPTAAVKFPPVDGEIRFRMSKRSRPCG